MLAKSKLGELHNVFKLDFSGVVQLRNVEFHMANHLLPVVDKDLIRATDDIVFHFVGRHLNHRGPLVDAVGRDKGLAGGGLSDDEL